MVKKGGLGGMTATKDISNVRRCLAVRKDTSMDVLSSEEHTLDVKPKLTEAPEKGKVGSREAAGDLTNSCNPTAEHAAKNILNWMEEEEYWYDFEHEKEVELLACDRGLNPFFASDGRPLPVELLPKRASPSPPGKDFSPAWSEPPESSSSWRDSPESPNLADLVKKSIGSDDDDDFDMSSNDDDFVDSEIKSNRSP